MVIPGIGSSMMLKQITPGSVSWGVGSFNFTMPDAYNTMTITVNGAGGSGDGGDFEGGSAYDGNAGTASLFNLPTPVIGDGGGGALSGTVPVPGAPGSASGGDTNTTGAGGAGAAGYSVPGGNGGQAIKTLSGGYEGTVISLVVGLGGSPPYLGFGYGTNGTITVVWS